MKISCQSCQSKYNVADEKVQGKIVKIRCRKCGATIVVNATSTTAANGSVPAPAAPSAPAMTAREPEPATAGTAEGGAAEWHVSISDNDQRTMTLAELVNAYNTGVVAADSFVWTEGMQDWKALSEVDAVVAALHAAAAGEAPAAGSYGYAATASAAASPTYATSPAATASPAYATSPAAASPAYTASPAAAYTTSSHTYTPSAAASPAYAPSPAAAASPAYEAPAPARTYERTAAYAAGLGLQAAVAAPAAEPKRAAVVKRESRARDLFATRTGEDVQAAMHLQDSAEAQLTGQRNENSVLFSLEHLTKSAEPRQPGSATSNTEDSGIIDLKALAAKAESMRPPTLHEIQAGPANLGLAPAQFAAPIGGYAPLGGAEPLPKSRLPVLIGAGAGIALLLVLGIIIGLKIGGAVAPAPMPSAIASAPPIPSASATAEPSATAPASATAQASASAAPTAKPHGYGGGAFHAKAQGGGGAGVAGGGGANGTAAAATTGGGGAGTGQTTAPKKNDCGCNGDLMCMMKCSTHQ